MQAINTFGIDTLPIDAAIYPAPVIALAQEIDTILIQWEEAEYRATDQACKDAIYQAEIADAAVLKQQILAGENVTNADTLHVDAAQRENHRAQIRQKALLDALNEKYKALREALIDNVDAIRENVKAEYEEAEKALDKVITKATTDFQKTSDRFGNIAGMPYLIAGLITQATNTLSAPYIAMPAPDFTAQRQTMERIAKVATAALGATPRPYLGTMVGENGMTWPVDLIRKMPNYDADGKFTGVVTLNDGTRIETSDEARAIIAQWDAFTRNLNSLPTI